MVHILHGRVHILLGRILFVNEMLVPFEAALIIDLEGDTEPAFVDDGGFFPLIASDSSILLLLLCRCKIRLANHFTLCVCVSLMMLLNG